MGIGKKSRKVKGKKRQTGRKLRRGSRHSRLEKMSLIKGGRSRLRGGAVAALEEGGTAQTMCDNIKRRLEALSETLHERMLQGNTERDGILRTLQEEAGILRAQVDQKQAEIIEKESVHVAAMESLQNRLKEMQADSDAQVATLLQEIQTGQDNIAQLERASGLQTAEIARLQDVVDVKQRELDAAKARNRELDAVVAESGAALLESKQRLEESQQALRDNQTQLDAATALQQRQVQSSLQADDAFKQRLRETILAIQRQVDDLTNRCTAEINGAIDALEQVLGQGGCLAAAGAPLQPS
jgi:chromosome segregation ATPase